MRHWPTRCLAVLVVISLAACAAQQTTDPIVRKFSWFAYLGAEDIRRQCEPGGLDRYRLIYNGVYMEQVRVYEIAPSHESGRFDVRIEISEQPDLSNIVIDGNDIDLLAPWRPEVTATSVPADRIAVLDRALTVDGLFGPPAEGLELSSIDFYWAAAACRGGEFHFTGYLWPDERFKSLAFPQVLAAWDFTGIALNPPRTTDPLEFPPHDPDQLPNNLFQVKVGDNGLSNSLFRN